MTGDYEEIRKAKRDYLLQNSNILFNQVRTMVPGSLCDKAKMIFDYYVDNIADNIFGKCVDTSTPQTGSYQLKNEDGNLGIELVVTAFPWAPEEAIEHLTRNSKEPPLGYTSLFLEIHNNRPSPDVFAFFHVVITIGEFVSMHLGGMPYKDALPIASDFTLMPKRLLNAEERRRFNF